jgi:hypothetical protein
MAIVAVPVKVPVVLMAAATIVSTAYTYNTG